MTEVKPLVTGADGLEQLDPAADSITLASQTLTGNLNMSTTGKVVNLATPTLDGDATTKVYVDTLVTPIAGDGINVAGSTISVDLVIIAPGLEISGSKLRVKVADVTLLLDGAGLSVAGVPSEFLLGGSAVSVNVTRANVDELVDDGAGLTELHWHEDRTKKAVSETVQAFDPICVSDTLDSRFRRAEANGTEQRSDVMGIMTAQTSAPNRGPVAGENAILTGIPSLNGATRGEIVYLNDNGGLTTTAPVGGGKWVVVLGRVLADEAMVVKFGSRTQL